MSQCDDTLRTGTYTKYTSLTTVGIHHNSALNFSHIEVFVYKVVVIPLGFEPKTHSLEGCCSIQLSYGTNLGRHIRNVDQNRLQRYKKIG